MKWLCKFWHDWEYIKEDVEFQLGEDGKPVVFFHEISKHIVSQFNIKPHKKSCDMRVCKRCSKKQIYYKGLVHNEFGKFLPDPNGKKTWIDYNHLTHQQLRQKKLKDLGLD